MATAAGIIGGAGSSSTSLFRTKKTSSSSRRKNSSSSRMFCVASYSVKDPYQTLRIQPGASESEVKKAFRQLALQYHPDVCRGSNCGVQFSQINEAYDIALRNLREEAATESYGSPSDEDDEPLATAEDMWEEWMGWEGAGIRDYSSHINPYI